MTNRRKLFLPGSCKTVGIEESERDYIYYRERTMKSFLTVGEIAVIFAAPAWKIRQVVDSLGTEIQRAGLYRMIPREALPEIAAKIQGKAAEAVPCK